MASKTDETVPLSITTIFFSSLLSGGAAGGMCDLALYPIDTIKTRRQSKLGFWKSGGFKNIYRGIVPAVTISGPSGAVFWATYESLKAYYLPKVDEKHYIFVHMGCSVTSELICCTLRVPGEVLKQRKQALLQNTNASTLGIRTLYRGFYSTLLRDLPYAMFQIPLWEYLKSCWQKRVKRECNSAESSIAGGFSVTLVALGSTPFDVVKTRIMLTDASQKTVKMSTMMKIIYRESGIKGFFRGALLRTATYTFGGFVYFGIYDHTRKFVLDEFFSDGKSHS